MSQRCAVEGCEDKGFLVFHGEKYCDAHLTLRQEQASQPKPVAAVRRLCHAPGTRGRECAEYVGHDGPHSFVPQTQRED